MKLLLTVCLTFLPAAAKADDLNVPPWAGDPGSTHQKWEFNTGPDTNPPPETDLDNPYGDPVLTVLPSGNLPEDSYYEELAGRIGVWELDGAFVIEIPNRPDPDPWKWLWIQLTWMPDAQSGVPQIIVEAEDAQAVPITDIELIDEVETPIGDPWHHITYVYEIWPNPAFETIYIGGSIFVDEIVIDTICIPEPATMGLLAFGGLPLLRRKR
jgi:hypothetical protein